MNSSTDGPGARSRGEPALLWWIAAVVLLVFDAMFALAPADARSQGAAYVIGVTGARAGFQTSQRLIDSVTWRNDDGEYQLDLLLPVGVYVSMRCLPSRQPSRASIVCVQATSARLHELESVISGLTIAQN
jgi:hypothetical protein